MKTNLNFETSDTKNLLAKLDFEFFLKQNIEIEQYQQTDIDILYESYKQASKQLKVKAKSNRKQFNYYVEGQVRKMFTGGLLPSHFELDESRGYTIFNFSDTGESWAYFEYWQSYQKRKITKERIWDVLVKTGSILAIALSIIKVLEMVNIYKS